MKLSLSPLKPKQVERIYDIDGEYLSTNNSEIKYKGTPYNTAGWTTVEVVGQIIEKIGPILATKYNEIN